MSPKKSIDDFNLSDQDRFLRDAITRTMVYLHVDTMKKTYAIKVKELQVGGLDSLALNSFYDEGTFRAVQQPMCGSPAPNPFETTLLYSQPKPVLGTPGLAPNTLCRFMLSVHGVFHLRAYNVSSALLIHAMWASRAEYCVEVGYKHLIFAPHIFIQNSV
ncbi:hypothetical protein M8C21_001010 [Ambrosia artemisiifolia]|uniref:Uncharacterized protein n=1 Tax=Ambrosia artemisiifolia TaxID=4212 RepID=A0AAD5BWC8_AMBAR|nr:hypothetical protein M8C21_001010 [Ambrosia artemisiifolia]